MWVCDAEKGWVFVWRRWDSYIVCFVWKSAKHFQADCLFQTRRSEMLVFRVWRLQKKVTRLYGWLSSLTWRWSWLSRHFNLKAINLTWFRAVRGEKVDRTPRLEKSQFGDLSVRSSLFGLHYSFFFACAWIHYVSESESAPTPGMTFDCSFSTFYSEVIVGLLFWNFQGRKLHCCRYLRSRLLKCPLWFYFNWNNHLGIWCWPQDNQWTSMANKKSFEKYLDG